MRSGGLNRPPPAKVNKSDSLTCLWPLARWNRRLAVDTLVLWIQAVDDFLDDLLYSSVAEGKLGLMSQKLKINSEKNTSSTRPESRQ